MPTERERRMYYQDIVYGVCNILDNIRREQGAPRLVVGVASNPSNEIWDCLEKIVSNQVRMWDVEVHDDHNTIPRLYTVPASTDNDAMLMAFILDKGLEESKYGNNSIVPRGTMELAKMHCKATCLERE